MIVNFDVAEWRDTFKVLASVASKKNQTIEAWKNVLIIPEKGMAVASNASQTLIGKLDIEVGKTSQEVMLDAARLSTALNNCPNGKGKLKVNKTQAVLTAGRSTYRIAVGEGEYPRFESPNKVHSLQFKASELIQAIAVGESFTPTEGLANPALNGVSIVASGDETKLLTACGCDGKCLAVNKINYLFSQGDAEVNLSAVIPRGVAGLINSISNEAENAVVSFSNQGKVGVAIGGFMLWTQTIESNYPDILKLTKYETLEEIKISSVEDFASSLSKVKGVDAKYDSINLEFTKDEVRLSSSIEGFEAEDSFLNDSGLNATVSTTVAFRYLKNALKAYSGEVSIYTEIKDGQGSNQIHFLSKNTGLHIVVSTITR